MIQLKRYLSNSECSEEETKKLRTTFDDRKTINCLENLPNELFYETFDYLEGCKLYEAFSNLNAHFQDILTCSSLRLKIDLRTRPETVLQHRSTYIIAPNRDRIVSLSLLNVLNDDQIFTLFPLDSSFSRLESLVLENIKSNEFILLLVGLMSLSRLFSLTVYFDYDPDEISNVYQIIFSLPVLKYSKLSFFWFEALISIPIVANEQFSGIEYLVIDHRCALDELVALLSYTPRLCRLTCAELLEPHQNVAKESLIAISSLTRISIARCYAKFDELEIFITKISPQLQVLRITSCRDAIQLNADRWERIISQHLPHLHVFDFNYEDTIDDDWQITPYHALINRFNSSFWIKRRWLLKLSIDRDDWIDDIVTYSIFPYRKSWLNFHEYEENDGSSISYDNPNIKQHGIIPNQHASVASPIIFSGANQLTVIDLSIIGNYASIIGIIGPTLAMVQITCLTVTRREIFIGTLIDLIQYLPNLDSLVVSSLAMLKPRCLSVEEARTLRLISNKNKITKVKLQLMSDLAQVQFLIDLCRRMQYLEVDCATHIYPECFVRFILMKNIKYVPNLFSMCLWISQAKDMDDILKTMIDLEQLRQNYTIKQIDNRIYLRWNLR